VISHVHACIKQLKLSFYRKLGRKTAVLAETSDLEFFSQQNPHTLSKKNSCSILRVLTNFEVKLVAIYESNQKNLTLFFRKFFMISNIDIDDESLLNVS
jgi:hypothetical protein